MAGPGSGGHNALSDAEKRARGTFRQDQSAAENIAKKAAKIVTGPWLSTIPEPTAELSEIGRKKYDEFTVALYEQNKLTVVTRNYAEQAAMLFEAMIDRRKSGKPVSAHQSDKFQRALSALKIAEDAKQIASPKSDNKFARVGFSNRTRQAR